MRKSTVAILFVVVAIFSVTSGFDMMDNNGKAGRTGSPGESTCTGCHTGAALNDGIGSVTISSPDLTNWQYTVGQTYTIDVTVARSGSPIFGFDCECLTSSNQNAGTLIVTNSQTHILNATVSTVVRKNMVHSLNGGATADTHTFSFHWTAPASNVGNVTFYVTGNATNGNNLSSGDHIYKTSQIVTPAAGTGIANADVNTNEFSVYPNPAHDNLDISYTAPANEDVSIQLFSIEGKEVAELYHMISDGTPQDITVGIPADLTQGIYLVRLIHGVSSVSHRIIIQ